MTEIDLAQKLKLESLANKYRIITKDGDLFLRIDKGNSEPSLEYLIPNKNRLPEKGIVLLDCLPRADGENKTLLEIGTGSNAILPMYAIQQKGYVSSTGVDVDMSAIHDAEKAKTFTGLNSFKLIESDVFSNVEEKFDVIVSNPPYMPQAPEKSKSSEYDFGGVDGYFLIDRIIKDSSKHLKENGQLLLLVPNYIGVEKTIGSHKSIFESMRQHSLLPTIHIRTKVIMSSGGVLSQNLSYVLSLYDASFWVDGELVSNKDDILSASKSGSIIEFELIVVSGKLKVC